MKSLIDDAATEPDVPRGGPRNTDERAIGALLEGLDEPQPPPARASGSDLAPRRQLDTALLPEVDRRQRRRRAAIGLVIGLTVTLLVGTVGIKTVFLTRNADAAAVSAEDPAMLHANAKTIPTPTPGAPPSVATAGTAVPAPPGTWTTPPSPVTTAPLAAVSSLPLVSPPTATSPAAASVKRVTRPTSSSPAEPRRGYGLTSDEP